MEQKAIYNLESLLWQRGGSQKLSRVLLACCDRSPVGRVTHDTLVAEVWPRDRRSPWGECYGSNCVTPTPTKKSC